MSPNLTESTRLAQSLTSSSNGNMRSWPIESTNSGASSMGLTAGSASLLDSSANGANTIPLEVENFAASQSASLFQSNLGSYSSVNAISSPTGLLGASAGPIGPSSGMSYKAVTLSKPNPDTRKSSVYKFGDSHENLTLAKSESPTLPLGNSGLNSNIGSSSNMNKTRAPSSSSSASGRLGSSSMNFQVKKAQADADSFDRYDSAKGSYGNGTRGSSKGNSSKGGVNINSSGTDRTTKHSVLSEEQLATFRTSFCTKHHQNKCLNSDSCEKSHCLTWQRRNPYEINYCPHLCPEIQFVKKSRKMVLYRRCTRGKNCNFAHSKEEELYHPLVYKTKQCSSFPKCTRYFCPFIHDPSEMRDASKFMFDGYQGSKGKGSNSSGENLKEDGKSKKGSSSSGSKASPGLDSDKIIDTDRVEESLLYPSKETYRDEKGYMLNTADYENYSNVYGGYDEDYNLHSYTNYDNEYGDEYNSQFAKDYPLYNKEYQNQFTSTYGADGYGVNDEVNQLDKDDQMTQFENLNSLNTTYGLDTVDRLGSANYYEDELAVGVNNTLTVEGMWSSVDNYNGLNSQSLSSNYQSNHHEYHQSYQQRQLPTSYQSYQHSSYSQRYQQGYKRASYKDAYQRQYNQHYQPYQDDGIVSYQESGYSQSYQNYENEYVDKDYYANYPDLPSSSNHNLSSSSASNAPVATNMSDQSVSASNREGTINQRLSNSASDKLGSSNLMSSNLSANNGDMSTSYSNYNSADNYHSPGNSYQSSDNTGSAYASSYPGNYNGSSYHTDYLDSGNVNANYLHSSSSSYLQNSSASNYLQSYYQEQDLGELQYDLQDQFSNLGLGGALNMSNNLDISAAVDLNSGIDRTLDLNNGLDLNSSMDGGMELNDMFVKIINEIEK